MIRVGINGYGRIGRAFHRQSLENDAVQVVAINSRAGSKSHAYLLKHDSMYGNLDHEMDWADDGFTVDGETVHVTGEADPINVPWGEWGVDVVVEATGRFRTHDLAQVHLKAGAKRVMMTAPSKDEKVQTFVMGVNHDNYNHEDKIVSNASCTTNALAPTMKVLNDVFGVENAMVTTVHAITSSQNILDNSNESDFRRARSLMGSVIPTTTGAMKAIGLVIPELAGRIDGMAFRVPVPSVSVLDIVVNLKTDVTVDEINEAFLKAESESLFGVLGTSDEPLVSIDFRKDTRSAIVDIPSTRVLDKRVVKLVVWYDNEWGYSARLNDLAAWIMR